MDYEEHVLSLSTADVRAIAKLRHEDADVSGEAIPTEMIQTCINTLNSDHMTKEEAALGYFTSKKFKTLTTWNEWKAGETKQIEQVQNQRMFGDPIDPITLPKSAIIMRPHWQ